jgi:hypothetical protein
MATHLRQLRNPLRSHDEFFSVVLIGSWVPKVLVRLAMAYSCNPARAWRASMVRRDLPENLLNLRLSHYGWTQGRGPSDSMLGTSHSGSRAHVGHHCAQHLLRFTRVLH